MDAINNPDYPSPPGLLGDKTFREGFAMLGRLGFSFDAQLYHPQIDELANLSGSFPDVKIVLNHIGVPLGIGTYRGKCDEVFSRWAASIKAIAKGASTSEKADLFARTAARFCRLNAIG